MVSIELDIFSGRPNPRWTLSPTEVKQLVDRVTADRTLLRPVDADAGGLGYRGYIVRVEGDSSAAQLWTRAGLPQVGRIGRGNQVAGTTAQWLTERARGVDGIVLDHVVKEQERDQGPSIMFTPCYEANISYGIDLNYWNTSPYISNNNCYNFAANNRTNTFAQPGRWAGSMYTALDCSNVGSAAVRDGWLTYCSSSIVQTIQFPFGITLNIYNYNVCLVIWPGFDFHWYRREPSGIWFHKPGSTAARSYDNSGNTITNPETCNRGPYTNFCGYYGGRGNVW